MQQIILLIHVIIAISIIALVLLQQGKGANMGAAFGSGSSNTLFGSRGPASFLMKLTGGCIIVFFITSLSLGYLATVHAKSNASMALPVATRTAPVKTKAPVKQKNTLPTLPNS